MSRIALRMDDVGASTNIVEADGNFRLQGGNRSIKFNNGSHEVVGLAQIASQKMQYASGRMTIDYGNSRVGIGTATYGVSPTHPLHVHMDVSNDTIDETKGLVKFQSTGGNGMIGIYCKHLNPDITLIFTDESKIGILFASLVAGIIGLVFLHYGTKSKQKTPDDSLNETSA